MSEAIAEFTIALQLRPNYGNAHNNLGSALASMGRIDEAITHFSEAVRLMPESEEARRNLEYATSLQSKPVKK
jgi:Flp pilus assembly protein TadD